MGFGDWLHWTSIIRDLYKNINKYENFDDRIGQINKYKIKNGIYGVIKHKHSNNKDDFKILMVPWKNNQQYRIFRNNPYIVTDKNYTNIVFFKIISSYYFINKKFLDDKHIVSTYCENIGIENYEIQCELYFTTTERNKVKKYLPNNEFIFIEPINYKVGRSYPFDKFQKIVETFRDHITFVQVSPNKFGIKKPKKLENVTYHQGRFTFREAILFMSYAKLAIVNHGGLSIAANAVNLKTIAIYSALMNPNMTRYKNETAIYVNSNEHSECAIYHPNPRVSQKKYPNGCLKCQDLFKCHDVNIIIDKIKVMI